MRQASLTAMRSFGRWSTREQTSLGLFQGEYVMEIRRLEQEIYAGKKFTARYKTNGYYDICASQQGFQIKYKPFRTPVERSFDDVFFGEWLEAPIAFGAFEGGSLVGYVEGALEAWNNRFRISNICVFDEAARGSGVGTALMKAIEKAAASTGARMVVLETQSCNENAIAFYRKHGFEMIGFDLYAYSNADPERHEIRVEMGKRLDRSLTAEIGSPMIPEETYAKIVNGNV